MGALVPRGSARPLTVPTATLPTQSSRRPIHARASSSAICPRPAGAATKIQGISERFGIAPRRYSTYLESYHGISVKYGSLIAANCSSCHGSHLILAASDPSSSIHPQNLPKTCGQCHPTTLENLLQGRVHVEAKLNVSPGVYAVRVFYTVFIGALLGFFLLHISLDVIRWLRRRYGQGTDQRTE
jgi:hypothetical protein